VSGLSPSFPASLLRVRVVRGATRTVRVRNIQPLKFLEPQAGRGTARVVLTSYGGGLVQGDQIALQIHAEPDTRLHLATQANSRVYRNAGKSPARQEVTARLDRGARVLVQNDPLVLHTGARFGQHQHWDLDPSANLILLEWFQGGRTDSGEVWAFEEYRSRLRVTCDGSPLLLDSLHIAPYQSSPCATARFGTWANGFLAIYFVGLESQRLARLMNPLASPHEVHRLHALSKYPRNIVRPVHHSLSHCEDRPLSVLRCIARTRHDYDPVMEMLFGMLMQEGWLDYNPLVETR